MRLAPAALLALATTTGCHLYFGDGRDDTDAGTWVPDAWLPIDAPWIDAPGPDASTSFPRPTAPTRANVNTAGAWIDQGLADWSCLGTPTADLPSTGSITLSGRTADWQTGSGLGGAAIVAYAPSTSATVGTGMSASAGATIGAYTMTLGMLPASSRRYTFVVRAQDHPGTYLLDQYVPPGATATRELRAFSTSSMGSLSASVGSFYNAANATVVGDIVDCQGRAVSNAVAVASRVRSQLDPIGGASSFYFSAGPTSVPVPITTRPVSNLDGKFMILDVPPISQGFAIQILGYRTQAEVDSGNLRLLGQVWAPAIGGTASLVTVEPRRSGN